MLLFRQYVGLSFLIMIVYIMHQFLRYLRDCDKPNRIGDDGYIGHIFAFMIPCGLLFIILYRIFSGQH